MPGAQKEGGLAKVLKPFVDQKFLAGAVVLVADKEKILDVETAGYADIEDNTLMGNDTLFWIASMSKPITAAALMLLVDEGKVHLDDPIDKYLPEFKDLWLTAEREKDKMTLKRPGKMPTIRQCLAHTSGMPFKSALEQPTLDHVVLRDAVRSYAITPLVSEPGTKYLYSNAGINTAGRIIEVVSGMPFETFLEKRLTAPLEMKDTTFFPNEQQVKRLAKSYKPNMAKTGLESQKITFLTYPLTDKNRQPMPGGGLFSTATDCGHFCQMLLNDGKYKGKKFLSEDAIRELSKRQTPESEKVSYGLGFAVSGDVFGHGGAYATNMSVDRKRGLILVYMVQHNGFPGNGGQAQAAFRKAAEEKFKTK
ncbi:MAG: beta-lactamase family protein [Gemmataceae bacterium]|nr:beta-lactamase family protein [Gemmataceae bacterium]